MHDKDDESSTESHSSIAVWIQLWLFGAAYILTAALAQWLVLVPGHSATLWPPSGVCVATLLHVERRRWWQYALVGLGADILVGTTIYQSTYPLAASIAMGNIAEGCCGAYLVLRFCGSPFRFFGLRDIFGFVILAGVLCPAISAMVGSASMATAHRQTFLEVWPLWWVGDLIGILVIGPATLAILRWRDWSHTILSRKMEAASLVACFSLAAYVILSGLFPFAFIALPLLLWATMRLGRSGAAFFVVALTFVLVRNTAAGHGVFVNPTLTREAAALLLQLFVGICSTCVLLLAALTEQRQVHLAELKRALDELEKRIAERVTAEQQLRLAERQIVEVVTDEQRRLGQELHDGLGQELTALNLIASYLQEFLRQVEDRSADNMPEVPRQTPEFKKLRHAVDNLAKNLQQTQQHLRDVSRGIMPVQIDAEGFRAALEELAASVKDAERIVCKLDCPREVLLSSNSVATHLYRIAQEAVNNALKHSRADQIQIVVRQNGSTTLEVIDNGIGIGTKTTLQGSPNGIGLRTMDYRANMMGGTLVIKGLEGGGTSVRCTVAADSSEPVKKQRLGAGVSIQDAAPPKIDFSLRRTDRDRRNRQVAGDDLDR